MTRSFNCASCSAPLEFEGTITQKCRYCSSTVIAPAELFYASSKNPFGDFSSLTGKALKIAEINQLIHSGKKLDAIKAFRQTFGVGLAEAKDAVERMERGESVDISSTRVKTSRPMTAEDIEAVKKLGFTIGGSIFATILVSLLLIGGVILAIFYFTWSAVKDLPTVTLNGSANASATPALPSPTPAIIEALKFGGEGNGAGRFRDNRHVAVGHGRIYSSDYSPYRIQVFETNGNFLSQWKGATGTNLYDLDADRDGNVYVTNDKGIFKFEGETGKLLAKTDNMYLNGMALTWDNKIVAFHGKAIIFLSTDLKLLTQIKDAGDRANTTFGFSSIAVDGAGYIYAIDSHNDDVCKFDADGKFLNRFPSHANAPHDIAVDPRGQLFVSDTNEIIVLKPDGELFRKLPSYQAFGLTFDGTGDMYVAARPYVIKYSLTF
jgi:sugar lactone lactonase YvrE